MMPAALFVEAAKKKKTMNLEALTNKIRSGQRINQEDARLLIQEENWPTLFSLADERRKAAVGDEVLYATTLFIHPTNLCELSCPMCSFYAKPGWKKAWFLTPEQIEAKVKEHLHHDLNEIHFVGGLWRDCDLNYYKEAFSRVKALDPSLHIKALTAVEYDFLARHHGISIEEVFDEMKGYGLGSLPGGGAEVLVDEIRNKLAPGKMDSDSYLNTHKIAHQKGLRSNITLLYGSIEEWDHIITHLDKVRTLQDETGGFNTFVPLKYHVENNAMGKRKDRLKFKNDKVVYALARLYLDNIAHLKILWNYVSISEALELLDCGGNDLGSTALDEKIITLAGGVQVKMNGETMEQLISSIGRIPKKVSSGEKGALCSV